VTRRTKIVSDALDNDRDIPLPGMGDPDTFRIPPGPVERALARSVTAAVDAAALDREAHAAAIRTAQSVARIVDRLTPAQTQTVTPYQAAQAVLAARELAAQLASLGLTPAGGGDVDPLDALLDGLGALSTT
jgi:hypothetical protein